MQIIPGLYQLIPLKTGIIMLIVVMALFVTALAACGNNRNPEEVATAYFEDGNSLLSN
ncbi:hypothetical protein [Bacillus thuringiensis]|uniref:hypothetical protein n=1 Tax=Bacillus thuringiensis TaxID=1428 RepID=UPI00159BD4AF|nr:hypothetical protein [Bacillus thuringiensis]